MPYFTLPDYTLQMTFNPSYPVTRTTIAPRLATPSGAGVTQLRRRYPRAIYQFTLGDAQMDKPTALALASFLSFHQGDRPFYWTGGEWGTIDSLVLVGIGDGIHKQFFLPNRHITGQLLASVGGITQTVNTIDGATGLIDLAVPVLAGNLLYASYTCLYKLVVWNDSEELMTESNIYAGLYRQNGVVLREVIP
jgi:hypothetical protein